MKIKKGIILAGGTGSRLYPLTVCSNKHFLPIYDKPLIYYPLTTLMLAGIRDILIITTQRDLPILEVALGTGENIGLNISYRVQERPNGLPEAFLLGEKFIETNPVAMILGDNFFHGHGLPEVLMDAGKNLVGGNIFVYGVDDPERYGVVVLDKKQKVLDIQEKPKNPKSNLAVMGLYYFDGSVSERAKTLKPSHRNELEIVDLIKSYIKDNKITVTQLGRGYVWFDAGTPKSLQDASNYVEVIQSRQGTCIASPEEVSWRMGFIDSLQFEKAIDSMPYSWYKKYLQRIYQQ
jgi:glucose-1-phosphate thymidylyltransferase